MTKNDVVLKLKQLARSSRTAEAVFIAFGIKGRSRAQIDLTRFKQRYLVAKGVKVNDREYITLFEELEKLGLGTVVRSSRGNPRKFKFTHTLRSIGVAALDGSLPVQQLKRKDKLPALVAPVQTEAKPVIPDVIKPKPNRELVTLVTRLGSGKVVRIRATEELNSDDLLELRELFEAHETNLNH